MDRKQRLVAIRSMVVVFTLGVIEAFSCGAILLLDDRAGLELMKTEDRLIEQTRVLTKILEGSEKLFQLDSELGWIYGAERTEGDYSTSVSGTRGQRVYAERPSPGTLRVAAFGDSFVFANEVADRFAWSAQAEALDPELEVLNVVAGWAPSTETVVR